MSEIVKQQKQAQQWFANLRDLICAEFEKIEAEFSGDDTAKFSYEEWQHKEGGGGVSGVMKGKVFEKVGVNISTVHGKFSEEFRKQIPGTENKADFWASGISLVAHMRSPLVPAVHMNTRFICTEKTWFGGGADLNPIYSNDEETKEFHSGFQKVCDRFDPNYYDKFKKWCDEYFWLKHRNEARGVGGIFYDYLNSGDFTQDFSFTQEVGKSLLDIFPRIVRKGMHKKWTEEEREYQLIKRGRYAEFNLLYDRGTKFGLMTGGNPESILMSMPPEVKWV